MKKFSKLNESVKIDQSKLESILSELEGVTYKVFNYFARPTKYHNFSFVEDISRIEPGSKNAKIILIKPKYEIESIDIEGWHENFKLNSSGFYFFKNPSDAKKHYDQMFNLLDKLKEYSPALCARDEKFIIYLIGDDVSKADLEVQEDLEKAYDKLYQLLENRSKESKKITNIDFWRQTKTLRVELRGNDKEKMTTLASLCPHMANKGSGFSWISSQRKDEELENIADIINEMGFMIEFISPEYSDDIRKSRYTFKLVEI